MMYWDDMILMWGIFVVGRRVKICCGGVGKTTGEGVYISLSSQILREESTKAFYTNIVFYFAGTFNSAWSYILAKPARVVLASLMLLPFRCN